MMRVALVGDYPLDAYTMGGGVEAAFAYLVRALARRDDVDIHVVTMAAPPGAPVERSMSEGVTFHRLPSFPRFELLRNYRTYQATLERVLAEIDPHVVHAQGATDHAYVCLRTHYPTVVTVHGLQREDARHQATARLRARKRFYSAVIERRNIARTRHLVAIARYVTDYFAGVISPAATVHYVANAVAPDFFAQASEPRSLRVLFAGRIVRRKRPVDAVRAFSRVASAFPGAELRLAGDTTDEPATVHAVQAAIDSAGLASRVRLLGALDDASILEEFASCGVLLLPSVQETAPMAIAQAFASGKPAVATRVGAVPEMIDDGVTGRLAAPGDIDGLARALRELLSDESLRVGMGATAREVADARYRADTVAAQTVQVYRQVVTRAPLAPSGGDYTR